MGIKKLTQHRGGSSTLCKQYLILIWSCIYWSFVWKTSVFIRLPALQETFSPKQIYWLADLVNLPADYPPSRFTDWQIWWICWQILPSRFTDWQIWWICQQIYLPANLLTGRFGESAGRFTLQQIYWLADLVNLLVDLPPKQICWLANLVNLPADLSPQQIYWQTDLVNLQADLPPSRFIDWQVWWICWQIYPPANLLTGRFGESASRFIPPADLLTGRFGESAGRFTPNPLANLLTGRFGESAGRHERPLTREGNYLV